VREKDKETWTPRVVQAAPQSYLVRTLSLFGYSLIYDYFTFFFNRDHEMYI
jgi:hypothetical protein